MRLLTTCIVATLSTASLFAQTGPLTRLDGSRITPTGIDSTVHRLITAAEVTGMQIALIDHGQIVFLKAYGFRDKEKDLPMTSATVMSAASFTKSAFAYMVMTLVDEKKLDLDKPVYQYLPKPLPEYDNYKDLAGDDRYKKISARMLLSHTAGFPNWRWLNNDRKLNLNFEPGARFAYSGEGIDLLQFVVETITGTPLDPLMQQRVFNPLGMTHSSMVWRAALDSNAANGYDEYGRSVGPHRSRHAEAAGSMLTTASDYARLLIAIMNGTGLSMHSRNEMLAPQIAIHSRHEFPSLATETTGANNAIRLSYGLGWGLYFTPIGEAFFKEGHDQGWRNYCVAFLKPKTGIVIMTNSSNSEGIYQGLLEALLRDSYTPIEWEGFTPYDKLPPRAPLKQHKAATLAPSLLDKYVGQYRLSPEIVLTVRRSGDHLSVQENDEPPQDLIAANHTEFFSTSADDEYTFQLDGQGRATALVLHTDGKDFAMKRTAAASH